MKAWPPRSFLTKGIAGGPAFVIGASKSLQETDPHLIPNEVPTAGINWIAQLIPTSFLYMGDPQPWKEQPGVLQQAADAGTLFVTRKNVYHDPFPALELEVHNIKSPHFNGVFSLPDTVDGVFPTSGTSAGVVCGFLLFLGFNPLYLIGVDFSKPRADTRNIKLPDLPREDVYFREDIPALGARAGFDTFRERVFFQKLLTWASFNGKEIYNCSPFVNELWDVLPRAKYKEALERCRSSTD